MGFAETSPANCNSNALELHVVGLRVDLFALVLVKDLLLTLLFMAVAFGFLMTYMVISH
jgi:hypothetical protein